jgi:hypothetical protein
MRPEGVLLDRFLVGGQWQDRAMYAITMPEWRGGRGGAHAAGARGGADEFSEAAEGAESSDASDASGVGAASEVNISFEGGPEEPVLGVPIPAQAEEPLVGETVSGDTTSAEASDTYEAGEPQMLTAQIVREQIEVVQILPREP